jgi:hypothetical protein
VSLRRVGAHDRVPAAVRVRVAEETPHGACQRRVVEGDLAEHAVVPRRRRASAAVGRDVLSAQGEDDELIDRREILHEVPRIFTVAQSLVHEHGELVGRLRAEQLETRPPAGGVVVMRHHSSLNAPSDAAGVPRLDP